MAVVYDPTDDIVFDAYGEPGDQLVTRAEYELRESLRADPMSGFYDSNRFGGFAPQAPDPWAQPIQQDLAAQNYNPEQDIFEPVNVMGSEALGPEPGVGVQDDTARQFMDYLASLTQGIFGFAVAPRWRTCCASSLQPRPVHRW